MKRTRTVPFVTHDAPELSAAVLAGGLGTRLRSVVSDLPKSLAPVNGQPYLAYLLDRLGRAGLDHVVLCVGYMAEKVRATFGDVYGGMRLSYSVEPRPLDTGGALRRALPLLDSRDVLVMNGDSFFESSLGDFAIWHFAHRSTASLLLAQVPDASRYGTVQVDGDGRVLAFREKTRPEAPGWINAGIYLLNREVLATIPRARPVSLEREIFPTLVGRGLRACHGRGRFIDIGTPESYARARVFFAGTASRAQGVLP